MSQLLGTTTSQYASRYPQQRKMVKTSGGTLVLFANVDGAVKYKTSTDNGANWSSWSGDIYGGTYLHSFSITIDSSDNILCTFSRQGGSWYIIYFKKLTYQSGDTWSAGSLLTIDSESSAIFYAPVITIRSNDDIWIGWWRWSSTGGAYYSISTDGGSNWSASATAPSESAQIYSVSIISKGSNIWLFTEVSNKLIVYEYTTSWDAGTEIVGSGITHSSYTSSCLKISDSDIWIAGKTTSGLKVFHYTGSWDSGTLISDNASDTHPSFSNINSKPVIVWQDYDGSNYDISYRVYNGSSWDAQIDINSDVTEDRQPTTLDYDDTNLMVMWDRGNSSPYDIYFESIALTTEVLSDIDNDFRTVKLFAFDDITNDFRMVGTSATIDINNDFRLSGASLIDLLNDFRMVGNIVRSDINNDFRFVEPPVVYEVTNDIFNLFNLVDDKVSDVNNDIRTHKIEINNISNDFRLIADWQIPGDIGFQSLGKTYIKVFIDSVEQTDANIDSGSINKILNGTHTATFELGRAYDSVKPDIEAMVEIKYNNWVLYKGYIIDISPTDTPESIRINCNDKYWKQNKTNKYFHIGHKPQDDKDLYYNTIKEGLSECNFSVDIGNFIPQTINCFGQGESNCISSLIQEAGNYSWFYKEDETKKLWEGGEGDIINIDAQSIGTNLGLYQILRHQFTENIEGIVNKFRVQMGEKTIRIFDNAGGTKSYGGFDYRHYRGYAQPDWTGTFEDTYGEDAPDGTWKGKEDVFTKYRLPCLDSELESYTDRYPPQVELYQSGSFLYGFPSGIITEGFTIDYENKLLIFDEPIFAYQTDSEGNITSIRRPGIKLLLWKKKYYSYTSSPSEDPETEVSNPLLFFTDKMGDYSETIIGTLDLSALSIQEGYTFYWWRRPGYPKGIHYPASGFIKEVEEYVPSWDDTDFAKDIADHQLSKICDKKITGSIDITLDAFLFYNIDLSKRIMINGVIDNPLNITSITINTSTFIVTLNLESNRYYKRLVSLPSRGE